MTDIKRASLKEWIAALRSGKYKQGRVLLRSKDDEYCCLGVLCEISGLQAKPSDSGFAYLDHLSCLPRAVADGGDAWGLVFGVSVTALVGMNDERGKSFEEIADYLEEHGKDSDDN